MKRRLAPRVLLLAPLLLLLLAAPTWARGGRYAGPAQSGPAAREPAAAPSAPEDPAPPPAEPEASPPDAPEGALLPPPTIEGSPAAGRTAKAGRGSTAGIGIVDWLHWYESRRERFEDYRAWALRTEASPMFAVGDANGPGVGKGTSRVSDRVRAEIVAALADTLDPAHKHWIPTEAAAYVALGKIATGREHVAPHLAALSGARSVPEYIRESAVLGLGHLARTDAHSTLPADLLDGVRDVLLGVLLDDAYGIRTRAFAGVALGLLADQPSVRPLSWTAEQVFRAWNTRKPARRGAGRHPHRSLADRPRRGAARHQPRAGGVRRARPRVAGARLRPRAGQRARRARAHGRCPQRLHDRGPPREGGRPEHPAEAGRRALRRHPRHARRARPRPARRGPPGRPGRAGRARHASPGLDGARPPARRGGHGRRHGPREGGEGRRAAPRRPQATRPGERAFVALALGVASAPVDHTVDSGIWQGFRFDAVEALRAGLEKGADAHLRSAFAVALGLARDRQSGGRMLELLRDADEDPELRAYAALALGLMGDARQGVVPALTDALASPRSELLRMRAATALGLLGGGGPAEREKVLLTLVTALETTRSQPFKGQIAVTLGRIGDANAVKPLAAILAGNREAHLNRAIACAALGLVGDEAVRPLLAETRADSLYTAGANVIYELLDLL